MRRNECLAKKVERFGLGEAVWCAASCPSLRRRYGPVLPTVAASLTDVLVRRSAAIQAPGLNLAAASMRAAFLFNQFTLPMA